MTTIEVKIKFKEYEFRRVKPTTVNSSVVYTNPEWINREVCIIPMPLTMTDRLIEKSLNNETHEYELLVETDLIIKKTIKKAKNIGRTYLPLELAGLDVLIIPVPQIENLYWIVEKEQDFFNPIKMNAPTIQIISQEQKLFSNHRTKNGFPKTYLISNQ